MCYSYMYTQSLIYFFSPWQAVQSRILVSSWQTQASPGPGNERWRKRFNMVGNPRSDFCKHVTNEWMREDKHHSAHPSSSSFSSVSTASPTTWPRMQRHFLKMKDERSGQMKHLPCPREFTLNCRYTETKKQRAMFHWECQALSRASLHSEGFSSFSAFFRSSFAPSTVRSKLKTFLTIHRFQANFVIPDLNPLLRFLLLLWFQTVAEALLSLLLTDVWTPKRALVSASSASSSCSLRTLACSSFTSKILLLSKQEALGSTTLENHPMFRC